MTNLLKTLDAQDFREKVFDQYKEKPFAESGFSRVKYLTNWSYAPNVISVLSAMFFVYFLTLPYTLLIRLLLGGVLAGILFCMEYAKRQLITGQGRKFYQTKSVSFIAISFLGLCVVASMYTSYNGGNKIIVETAQAPTLSANSEIEGLESALAVLNTNIAKQQSTTWKGRITVDANKNLKALFVDRSTLLSTLNELKASDRKAQAQSDTKYNATTLQGGLVTGVIAVISDIVLIFLLLTVERIKYNVFRVENSKGKRTAGFQMPNTAPSTPSFSNNISAKTERRPIGFEMPIKAQAKNVFNTPTSFDELQALISGHRMLKSAYGKRKKDHSKNKAAYHDKRYRELQPLLKEMKKERV